MSAMVNGSGWKFRHWIHYHFLIFGSLLSLLEYLSLRYYLMPFLPWIVPTQRLHQGCTPLFPALSHQWVIEYQHRPPKKAVGSPSWRSSEPAWTRSWIPCSMFVPAGAGVGANVEATSLSAWTMLQFCDQTLHPPVFPLALGHPMGHETQNIRITL